MKTSSIKQATTLVVVEAFLLLQGIAPCIIAGGAPEPAGLPNASTGRYELDLSKLRLADLTPKPNWGGVSPAGERIIINQQYIERDGKPWIMVAGEIHPTRFPAAGWEDQILKMKAGGLNSVSVYVFWNHHEQDEGVFTWTGDCDFRRFVQLCAKHGMSVFLRVGPYCNGDCINGGIPQFLKDKGIKFRTNDPVYLEYVRKLYQEIGNQMKGLMFKDGGPIVAIQVENEFEVAPTSWGFAGSGGKEHMLNLKRLAVEAGLVAPLYICTAWGNAPVPAEEFIPGHGGYPFMGKGGPSSYYYTFDDSAARKLDTYDPARFPIAGIEIGTGMVSVGQWRPVSPPESVEALALITAANGSNLQGYYLYQACTQFIGKHGSTSSLATLSYDWHSPLKEFGQTSAIYDFMKPVNYFQSDFGDLLAPMVTAIPAHPVVDSRKTAGLRYAARANGESGFLFLNNYQDRLQLPDRHGLQFDLKFPGSTLRIPEQGSIDLKHNQCAILPFNLNLDGALLKYAIAQLYTRTQTDDGRNIYVFFVPEGMPGSFVFDDQTIESVKAREGKVSHAAGRTTVSVEPGTGCLFEVKSKSGHAVEILVLTRQQALRLTRQDIFGARRLVISDGDAISAEGKLRVSQIGNANLSFVIFPAPKDELIADAGKLAESDDGVFRRYSIQLPEVKPAVEIEGIGSATVKIQAAPTMLNGVSDVFLRVRYVGDSAKVETKGTLLCDNLFDRTPWDISLKRFREKLGGEPLILSVTPPKPIAEIIDNMEINSAAAKPAKASADLQVGTYEADPASQAQITEKEKVISVEVRPEYAVWVNQKKLTGSSR